MGKINKTRYAVLGMLLDGPFSGYEIKSLMGRSTAYFWQESDSTIYPMLKLLEKEEKVASETVYVGKKRKVLFSLTDLGREEFQSWLESPTGSEVQRNEFLLKLFFATDQEEIDRLLRERLDHIQKIYEEYKGIEERLENLPDSFRKKIRLRALRYGIDHILLEMRWLKEEF